LADVSDPLEHPGQRNTLGVADSSGLRYVEVEPAADRLDERAEQAAREDGQNGPLREPITINATFSEKSASGQKLEEGVL
jgi:hypothetical protein